MTPLEQQDETLRREADALLASHDVLAILRAFGTPHLSGSYALRLMTWRDLDIYLEMQPLEVALFLDLIRRLGTSIKPRRISFIDQLNFPSTEAVSGLYAGMRTNELSRGGWKLDIWGVTPEVCAERLAQSEALAENLSGARREAALQIKNAVCRLPGYRDAFTSQDVYDAVIAGATSLDDFWRFVEARRR